MAEAFGQCPCAHAGCRGPRLVEQRHKQWYYRECVSVRCQNLRDWTRQEAAQCMTTAAAGPTPVPGRCLTREWNRGAAAQSAPAVVRRAAPSGS
eukprot:1480537-Alexandrium_andersonii.AAC.1